MPRSEYKQLITYLLPHDTGMYVLEKVLTMDREDAESAQSWVQHIHKGWQRVCKHMQTKTNLSDAFYRELIFRGLVRKEQGELLIKAQIQRAQLHKYEIGDQVMANWGNHDTYFLLTEFLQVYVCEYIVLRARATYAACKHENTVSIKLSENNFALAVLVQQLSLPLPIPVEDTGRCSTPGGLPWGLQVII